MRKPLLALSLVASTGFGAIPVADAAASNAGGPVNTGSTPPKTSPLNPLTVSRPTNAVSGAAIVAKAMQYIGYPYTTTGNSPATGFSCIGFVSYVYRSLGIPLPGDLGGALGFAPQVPFNQLQPGDILYFANTVWPGVSHAAIYVGGGRFVHSEWYGVGVRVSSFNNDPKDYNYWIGHYMGANRPWTGAPVGAVLAPPAPPSVGARTTSPTTSTAQGLAGTPSLVTVPSVYVRAHPGKGFAVKATLAQGTSVTVIGKTHGWYKVQMPDGTIGWIIAEGLGGNTVGSTTVIGANGLNGSNTYSGANPTIGNPTAPQIVHSPARHRAIASVRVTTLRVHSGPSTSTPVISSVAQGQKLRVIGRRNGWLKVQFSDGTVGWVSAAYTSVRRKAVVHPAAGAGNAALSRTSTSTRSSAVTYGKVAQAALNVRSAPAMSGGIVTVLAPGGDYHVLGWSNGWAHVQLPNGTTGWISSAATAGRVKRAGGQSRYRAGTRAAAAPTRGRSVITAGVRMHSSPGKRSAVIGLVAAGTHVTVLGQHGRWVLVRLSNGTTGYVLGSYVG